MKQYLLSQNVLLNLYFPQQRQLVILKCKEKFPSVLKNEGTTLIYIIFCVMNFKIKTQLSHFDYVCDTLVL